MNYLAIDLGAESGRVILGSLNGDQLTLEEIHRFSNIPIRSGVSLHWDIARILPEIHTGLAAVNKPIHSLSVDSWGVDYVLLNSHLGAIEPTFHYRDPRTKTSSEEFLMKVPWRTVFAETGIQFMPINTLYQLAAETPERISMAHQILGIADMGNYYLGAKPCIEESMASTFQLYNPLTRNWSDLLLRELNIPQAKLAPVVRPGSVIGDIRPGFVKENDSFKHAKIIATCSHDTGCAVAAVPATGKKWAYLSSGTWSLMGVEIPPQITNSKFSILNSQLNPIIHDASRALNFTNEIGYGNTIRLLKNISGLWLLQECRRAWTAARQTFDYAELTHLAEKEPPTKSLIDPMDPRFLAPPSMPDAIADYCREKNLPIPSTPAAITRAIFESLVQLYAKTLHQLEQLTAQKIERLHIVGGGSKNNFLNQLTANACQIEVRAGPVEATALGNIIIQAIARGEIKDLQHARALIQKNFPVTIFKPS